jgi:uncharacterized protein with HEPN domain
MPLNNRDAAYLWDMLQAAKEVNEMMAEHDLAGFLDHRMLQRAVERLVEMIGESARHVSATARTELTEIPWHKIIGQRNIPAHEYGQIDHELLYKTVVDDIPELIRCLGKALPPIENT